MQGIAYAACLPPGLIRVHIFGGNDMDTPVELPYARKPRRWTRRRIIVLTATLSAIGALITLAHFGYGEFQRRANLLNKTPGIGPVDWRSTLTSWTRLKLAWRLSSSPLEGPAFLMLEDHVVGVTALSAAQHARIDLVTPLRHADGKLHLTFSIKNKGKNLLLVPPLERAGRWGAPYGSPGDLCIDGSGYLSAGARLLRTGESALVELVIPEGALPHAKNIWVVVFPNPIMFQIHADDRPAPTRDARYDRWEDVPQSEIQCIGQHEWTQAAPAGNEPSDNPQTDQAFHEWSRLER